jgi:FMN phosphatase YigB (HAD superfamily)
MKNNFNLDNINLPNTYKVANLTECLKEDKISLVAIDVDNTLVDTSPFYKGYVRRINLELAPEIDSEKEPDLLADEISEVIWRTYREGGYKPQLIAERYLYSLGLYLNKEVPTSLKEQIEKHFADFYITSPPLFEKTPTLINSFLSTGTAIVFHSHAQDKWTEIKVNKIIKECGLDKYDIKLPYLGTPIDKDKDADSWLRAYKVAEKHYGIKINPRNVLNIGDNWVADIYPGLQAGCKNFIWIKNHTKQSDDTIDEFGDDIKIVETEGIDTAIDDYISNCSI